MNVILLSLDSVRSDFFGPDGRVEDTPAIDRLCERGAYFPNCIVQAPFTAPSHAAMLTGLVPYRNGIRDLGSELYDGVETVFPHVKGAGFETYTFLGAGMLKDRGFDDWGFSGFDTMDNIAGTLSGVDDDVFVFIHYWYTHTPYRAETAGDFPMDLLSRLYMRFSDIIGWEKGFMGEREGVIRNIWRLGYKFFWKHRMERIRDWMVEDEAAAVQAATEGYEQSIQEADAFIEELWDFVEEELDGETVLIVTSDHGESFNEHGERSEVREYEHGHFLYQNAIRVPLVIHGPGIASETVDQQVRGIDVAPTVLDLCGIDVLDMELDGVSVFEERGRAAYSEVHRPPETVKKCIVDGSDKVIRAGDEDTGYVLPAEDVSDSVEDLRERIDAVEAEESDARTASEEDVIEERLRDLGYL